MQTKFTHNKKDEHQKPKSDPQKSNEQNLPKQEVIPPGAKLVKISDFRTVHRRAEDIKLKPKDAEFYFGLIEDILQVTSPKDETIEWVHILGYGAILESVLKTTLKERYIDENIPASIDEYFRDYSDEDQKDPSKRFYNHKKHSKSIIQFVQALKTINRAWNAGKHSLTLQTPAIECLRYLLEFISYTSGKRIPRKLIEAYDGTMYCKTLKDYDKLNKRKAKVLQKEESTPPPHFFSVYIFVDAKKNISGDLLKTVKQYIRIFFGHFYEENSPISCNLCIIGPTEMHSIKLGKMDPDVPTQEIVNITDINEPMPFEAIMGIMYSMFERSRELANSFNFIIISDEFATLHDGLIKFLLLSTEKAIKHNISPDEMFFEHSFFPEEYNEEDCLMNMLSVLLRVKNKVVAEYLHSCVNLGIRPNPRFLI